MPSKVTVCGLVAALSVRVMDPVSAPMVVGLKVTVRVQLPALFTVEPHVFVWTNGPVTATFEMFRTAIASVNGDEIGVNSYLDRCTDLHLVRERNRFP